MRTEVRAPVRCASLCDAKLAWIQARLRQTWPILNLSLFRWLFLLLVLLASPLKTRAATTNFFEGFEAGLTNWVVGDADPTSVPAYWGIVDTNFGGAGTHRGNFKAYCAVV